VMRAWAGALLALLLLPACGGTESAQSPAPAASAPKPKLAIRYGSQVIPPDLVLRAKDWGAAYNLDIQVTEFSSSKTSSDALLAGQVDVISSGTGRLITMLASQPDKVFIGGTVQYGGDRYAVMVKPDSAYKSVQELKGQALAADKGTGTYETFVKYLSNNGMSTNDFKIVQTKVTDMPAAVASGTVAAAVGWEPTVSIGVSKNLVKRLTTLKGVNESPAFFLFSRDFAKQNPDAVTAFLAAFYDVDALISKKPDKAGQLAADTEKKAGTQVDATAMADSYRHCTFNPQVTQALLDELNPLASQMLAKGEIKQLPDLKTTVDTSFVSRASAMAGKNK